MRAVIYIPQRGAYGNAASAQVDIFEVEEGEGGMEDLGRLCKRLGGGLYREEKFEVRSLKGEMGVMGRMGVI